MAVDDQVASDASVLDRVPSGSTFEDEEGVVHRVTRTMTDAANNDVVVFTPCLSAVGGFWMKVKVTRAGGVPNCLGCIAEGG